MVEQCPVKALVVGSNPTSGAMNYSLAQVHGDAIYRIVHAVYPRNEWFIAKIEV